MNFKKINEMWNSNLFHIEPYYDLTSFDLRCDTEDCSGCQFNIIDDVFRNMSRCYFSDIHEKEITIFLLENKPKEILKIIKNFPKPSAYFWLKKIQGCFPINEYPEYYI